MYNLNHRITILVILLSANLFSQELSFNYLLVPEELKANSNAIVLNHEVDVIIKSQKILNYTVRKAITVKNERGDRNSLIRVQFDKNKEIHHIRAEVYDQFGKQIKKIKKKDFENVSTFDGFSLYSDSRMLYYDYTPTSYPYTIVYEYEIESNSTGFIPGWYPIPGYYTAVQSSSYKISSEAGIPLRSLKHNFSGFPIEELTNSTTELHFRTGDIPSVKYEPYGLQFEDYFPVMRVAVNDFSYEGLIGSASDWSSFGKWQNEFLLKDKDILSEKVKQEVQGLVAHISDPVEKAKIIYKFMQDRTRYISVQVGIGGWMPFPAQEVHDLGYGDCKGLTIYTKALLESVGVPSNYTLIYGSNNIVNFEKDFHSMQGNHAILNLPTEDGDIWLECTSQKVPFGFIAGFTDDRDVLVMTPEGGVIKHTKKYSPEENGQFTKGTYTLDYKGGIMAELAIETTGFQYNSHMQWYEGSAPIEQEKTVKNYLGHISDIQVQKLSFKNNLEDAKYEEVIAFQAENYSSLSGNQMFVEVNAFNRMSTVPRRIRNRKIPMDLDRGYVDYDEITVHLPKSMKVEYVPEKVELTSEFGTYTMEIEKIEGHTYLYKRTLNMLGGKYGAESYEAYRKFRKNINKFDKSKIILTKLQL